MSKSIPNIAMAVTCKQKVRARPGIGDNGGSFEPKMGIFHCSKTHQSANHNRVVGYSQPSTVRRNLLSFSRIYEGWKKTIIDNVDRSGRQFKPPVVRLFAQLTVVDDPDTGRPDKLLVGAAIIRALCRAQPNGWPCPQSKHDARHAHARSYGTADNVCIVGPAVHNARAKIAKSSAPARHNGGP